MTKWDEECVDYIRTDWCKTTNLQRRATLHRIESNGDKHQTPQRQLRAVKFCGDDDDDDDDGVVDQSKQKVRFSTTTRT